MFEFHADRDRYYNIQAENCKKYVIPFIEKYKPIIAGLRVLEIGCGEAGVLQPFLQMGCFCVGVELQVDRMDLAKKNLSEYIDNDKLKLIGKDIYLVDSEKELGGKFDIIILKDVIEHIHNQPKLITEMKRFLNPKGCIFFGFPPWQMPFGGHQQMNSNKWLSKLPYYHLLPRSLYKYILTKWHGPVDALLEIRDTRISIEKFERIAKETGYSILNKQHYLFNPIYEYKFNIKAKPQFGLISKLPFVRNYLTTCVYYLIG